MDFGQIIGRTFPILGRYRYLFVLAMLGGGEFGGSLFSLQTPGFNSSSTQRTGFGVDPAATLAVFLVFLAAAVLLVIAWFVLSLITTPALIRAAAEHDAQRPFGLGPAFRAGLQSAWKVFVLRLLVFLAVVLVFLVASLPILGPVVYLAQHSRGDFSSGLAAMIGGFIVSILLLLVLALLFLLPLSVVVQLALRSVVLELTGPFQALGRGLRLLTHRFGRVALTWLISVGFGLAAGLVAGVVSTPLVLLLTLGSGALVRGPGGDSSALTLSLVGGALLSVILVVVNGVLGSFFSVYWTLAFRRLEL